MWPEIWQIFDNFWVFIQVAHFKTLIQLWAILCYLLGIFLCSKWPNIEPSGHTAAEHANVHASKAILIRINKQLNLHGCEQWSSGNGRRLKFQRFESLHQILDAHFSHLFVVKIVMFVWKDTNKWKRGRGWLNLHWHGSLAACEGCTSSSSSISTASSTSAS